MIVITKPTKRNGETKLLGIVKIDAHPPIIGCKFNGNGQMFIDTPNNVYWQVMPTLSEGELKIQAGIVNKKLPMLWVDPRIHVKSESKELVVV